MSRIRFGLAVVLVVVGCAPSEEPLNWEEFMAQVVQEPDTGVYIANGDEMAETVDELRALYSRYLDSHDAAENDGISSLNQPLIVNRVGGADDKWSSSAAANITYCISSSSFGSRYSAVVNAMSSAAGAWEGTANVNFVHSSGNDGNCTKNTSSVVFNVRQVCSGQYLARSFFPSTSRRGREILIDCTSFGNIKPWSPTGVLRHELGHSLGFRHEHTRPEAGTCFENNQWRALTAYDSASVMHYPQCNGTNNGDLNLTSLDKTGARSLYP